MTIELICPSRGRPDAAKEVLASFIATKVLRATRLVFAVDIDDQAQDYYPADHVVIGPSTGDPTGPLNRVALASDADIVGFMGDDSRFSTKGWDRMVEEALREPGYCWGDDGHDIPWPSTAFVTREIVRRIGYFVVPTLHRGFFDKQWMLTAREAHQDHVIAARFPHDNHGHPVPKDIIDADERAFNAWVREGAQRDVDSARLAYDIAHFFPKDLVMV